MKLKKPNKKIYLNKKEYKEIILYDCDKKKHKINLQFILKKDKFEKLEI